MCAYECQMNIYSNHLHNNIHNVCLQMLDEHIFKPLHDNIHNVCLQMSDEHIYHELRY